MKRLAALAAMAAVLGPVAAWANEPLTYQQALRRLRACVTSGASNSPHADLREALVAVRSLCRPQIDRVYAQLDARTVAQNPAASDDRIAALQASSRRALDDDLARLIATQTGLAQ